MLSGQTLKVQVFRSFSQESCHGHRPPVLVLDGTSTPHITAFSFHCWKYKIMLGKKEKSKTTTKHEANKTFGGCFFFVVGLLQ